MAKYRCKHDPQKLVQIAKFGKSKTDPSFEKECRIDRILYKYSRHLPLEDWQMKDRANSKYLDMSVLPKDPESLQEFMSNLNAQFNELPAVVRRRYNDNPMEFAYAVSGQSVEASEAAKFVDEEIKRSKSILNPTLTAILEKSKEMQKQAMIEAIKESEVPDEPKA